MSTSESIGPAVGGRRGKDSLRCARRSVMTWPRLVPSAPESPYPTESTPTYEGLISRLGIRSDAGVDAASTGVGLAPMFQPVV